VLVLAMLPEPLSMIRSQDDDCAFVDASLFEKGDQLAGDGVGCGDLAIVWLRAN